MKPFLPTTTELAVVAAFCGGWLLSAGIAHWIDYRLTLYSTGL